MNNSAIWLAVAAFLTIMAGPLTFVAAQAGRADPADIYLLVDAGAQSLSESELMSLGATDVGPQRGMLAKMIHAPHPAREQLLEAGYVLFPAGALAALCGIDTDGNALNRSI